MHGLSATWSSLNGTVICESETYGVSSDFVINVSCLAMVSACCNMTRLTEAGLILSCPTSHSTSPNLLN